MGKIKHEKRKAQNLLAPKDIVTKTGNFNRKMAGECVAFHRDNVPQEFSKSLRAFPSTGINNAAIDSGVADPTVWGLRKLLKRCILSVPAIGDNGEAKNVRIDLREIYPSVLHWWNGLASEIEKTGLKIRAVMSEADPCPRGFDFEDGSYNEVLADHVLVTEDFALTQNAVKDIISTTRKRLSGKTEADIKSVLTNIVNANKPKESVEAE